MYDIIPLTTVLYKIIDDNLDKKYCHFIMKQFQHFSFGTVVNI